MLNRLTADMDDSVERLTADMNRFFTFRGPNLGHWDLFLLTFDRSLVVEESLGAPKVTVWGPGSDFL